MSSPRLHPTQRVQLLLRRMLSARPDCMCGNTNIEDFGPEIRDAIASLEATPHQVHLDGAVIWRPEPDRKAN
jgi:hypothetical protein